MSICPNCGYELVLLLSRLKYKCALCSRLYPQKEVETRNFRIWNQKQRENDFYNFGLEEEKRRKMLVERKIMKAFRFLFGNLPKNNSPEHKVLDREERVKLFKKEVLGKVYKKRLNGRLSFWRYKQKQLALQFLKNGKQEASKDNIFQTPFTFSLSQLLL
ncbi:hypothetical protein HYT57_03845 [Candidatus Woesearchaeota archaeon]|nr:hypothetical protein [Candidatus Woesearchaeota archaeon]